MTNSCVIRWVAAAALLVAGCSADPTTGDVVGTVTINGKTPPPGSSITFIPVDGKSPTSGASIEDGKYSARVAVGMVKVEIRAPRVVAKANVAKEGPGAGRDIVEESLPAKYNDETTLRLEVKPGRNPKPWDLTTD